MFSGWERAGSTGPLFDEQEPRIHETMSATSDEKKKHKKLGQELSLVRQRQDTLRGQQRLQPAAETEAALRSIRREVSSTEKSLEIFESNVLIRKARHRGIEIPRNSTWWRDDSDEYDYPGAAREFLESMTTTWLSETGRAMVTRLILDDRKKNIEWWIKIVMPILGALISILGLFVALITITRR
jgi:hypothetical protein